MSANPGHTALTRMPSVASTRGGRADVADDRVLGQGVERVAGHGREARERRRRDDHAPARPAQRGHRGRQPEHDMVDVDAHDRAIAREVEVFQPGLACRDPGVEQHDVEAAEGVFRDVDGHGHRVGLGDVAGQRKAADLLGEGCAHLPRRGRRPPPARPRPPAAWPSAAPIPDAPPVISAAFPSRSISSSSEKVSRTWVPKVSASTGTRSSIPWKSEAKSRSGGRRSGAKP